MECIELSLQDGQSYPICIERGLLNNCGAWLSERFSPCKIMLVTDDNVAPLYIETVKDSLISAGFTVQTHIVAAGEPSKSIGVLGGLLEAMADARLTRTDLAVSLGGGIVGDLTGFAAGCYLRGIRFVQMPTTLLAAVDASVGGKTAVNLPQGKNLAGLFHQPSAVLCDPDAMKTLTDICIADGAAEAIKTGILGDTSLFEIYESKEPSEHLTEIIAKSVAYKSKIVMEDPTEKSVRKLLNLGHTVGHAIEIASRFDISHGHAVAIGTAVMTRAAKKRGIVKNCDAERILQTLVRNHLPIDCPYSAKQLADIAQTDKKSENTSITVIIPEQIGKCRMEKIELSALEALISDGMEGQE